MRIVFMGGRPLGALCLEELITRKLDVVLAVPNSDEFDGGLWYRSTADIASGAGIPVYGPADMSGDDAVRMVEGLAPDVIFSIFFLQVLRKPLLDVPRQGCINVHFAQLPRYRGCYPQMHAIMNGEKQHGVSMHYMDQGIDSGDIIIQKTVPVEESDTARDLYFRCVEAGFEIFREALDSIISGKAPRTPQRHEDATYYKKGIPNHGAIDLGWEEDKIQRYIRALTFEPFPPPYFYIGGRKYVITPGGLD